MRPVTETGVKFGERRVRAVTSEQSTDGRWCYGELRTVTVCGERTDIGEGGINEERWERDNLVRIRRYLGVEFRIT